MFYILSPSLVGNKAHAEDPLSKTPGSTGIFLLGMLNLHSHESEGSAQ